MKKSYLVLLSIASFFLLNSLCKMLTDDFSTDFLTPPVSQDSVWANTPIPENLKELIDQEYVYLGKGQQAYAFLSKDGKHVFKLFKPARIAFQPSFFGKTYKIGLSKVPFIKSLCVDYSSAHYKEVQKKEFQSYFNAITLLPEETKVEYVHLASTQYLKKKLKIYDKIGVLHTIDLDNTSFLIQKRVNLLYPTLLQLVKKNEMEKAKILLKNFIAANLHLIDKNIDNPTIEEANIGCLDFHIVQIDVGRLLTAQDLGFSNPKIPLSQIYTSTAPMKKWLQTHNALELYQYFIQTEEELVKLHELQSSEI
ncbi:MAG: hypothetical protein K2Y01_00320 [Rhabdochlamydiaceae bacterium]|nr:hypothetical protein [Rhabdochlamydiaceae bacterium]